MAFKGSYQFSEVQDYWYSDPFPVESAEQRLVLTVTNDEPDSQPLRSLELTRREAEVLLWVSQGKRNSEIAEIIGARLEIL